MMLNGLLRQQVMDLEGRLLWRCRKPAFDALLHSGHQDILAEPLPTLLGVVDCHDCPAAGRRAGRMEDLALRLVILILINDAPLNYFSNRHFLSISGKNSDFNGLMT